MLGVLANAVGIVIGGLVGVALKKGIKERYTQTVIQGLGLAVVALGLMGAMEAKNMLVVIISIAIGCMLGEWIDIERKLENIGHKLENKFSKDEGENKTSIAKGFVAATLVFCSGGMAIVGSLQSGIEQNHSTLFVKAIIDGVISIVLASTMGIGVAFSSLSVFLYQGLIALTGSFAKGLLTDIVIADMSAVGGIMILGIGLNILGMSKIKVGNMIPAVIIPIIYYSIF